MPRDPYQDWLNIPPGPRPPLPLQLLGLKRLPRDPSSLDEAAQKQVARLDPYAAAADRPTRDAATRLMNEVAKARNALAEQIRTMSVEANASRTASTKQDYAIRPAEIEKPPAPTRSRSPHRLPWIIASVSAVACFALGLVAAITFDSPNSNPSSNNLDAQESTSSTPPVVQDAEKLRLSAENAELRRQLASQERDATVDVSTQPPKMPPKPEAQPESIPPRTDGERSVPRQADASEESLPPTLADGPGPAAQTADASTESPTATDERHSTSASINDWHASARQLAANATAALPAEAAADRPLLAAKLAYLLAATDQGKSARPLIDAALRSCTRTFREPPVNLRPVTVDPYEAMFWLWQASVKLHELDTYFGAVTDMSGPYRSRLSRSWFFIAPKIEGSAEQLARLIQVLTTSESEANRQFGSDWMSNRRFIAQLLASADWNDEEARTILNAAQDASAKPVLLVAAREAIRDERWSAASQFLDFLQAGDFDDDLNEYPQANMVRLLLDAGLRDQADAVANRFVTMLEDDQLNHKLPQDTSIRLQIQAAGVLTLLGRQADAGRWYQIAAASIEQPSKTSRGTQRQEGDLAVSLARHGRLDEAMRVLSRQTEPPDANHHAAYQILMYTDAAIEASAALRLLAMLADDSSRIQCLLELAGRTPDASEERSFYLTRAHRLWRTADSTTPRLAATSYPLLSSLFAAGMSDEFEDVLRRLPEDSRDEAMVAVVRTSAGSWPLGDVQRFLSQIKDADQRYSATETAIGSLIRSERADEAMQLYRDASTRGDQRPPSSQRSGWIVNLAKQGRYAYAEQLLNDGAIADPERAIDQLVEHAVAFARVDSLKFAQRLAIESEATLDLNVSVGIALLSHDSVPRQLRATVESLGSESADLATAAGNPPSGQLDHSAPPSAEELSTLIQLDMNDLTLLESSGDRPPGYADDIRRLASHSVGNELYLTERIFLEAKRYFDAGGIPPMPIPR